MYNKISCHALHITFQGYEKSPLQIKVYYRSEFMKALNYLKDKVRFLIAFVVRRLRINLNLWNMPKQMTIKGAVLCKCGSQIISNSGKVMMNGKGQVQCWGCGKIYDGNEVYYERKENKCVTF